MLSEASAQKLELEYFEHVSLKITEFSRNLYCWLLKTIVHFKYFGVLVFFKGTSLFSNKVILDTVERL